MPVIPFGHASGAIPLSDIRDFFGGNTIAGVWTPPSDMGSFYKGGSYVPNISQNSAIATSGALSLGSFRSAYTSLEFQSVAGNKSGMKLTNGVGNHTLTLAWYSFNYSGSGADWVLGYGDGMNFATEYYFTRTENTGSGLTTGASLTSTTPTAWTAAGASFVGFGITATVPRYTEAFMNGNINMYVRHPNSPSSVLTDTIGYTLNFQSGL